MCACMHARSVQVCLILGETRYSPPKTEAQLLTFTELKLLTNETENIPPTVIYKCTYVLLIQLNIIEKLKGSKEVISVTWS